MDNLLAINLHRARVGMGFTMEQLANLVNCSKQSIGHYETGIRTPDSTILNELSKALKVDLNYFFTPYNVTFSLNSINYREGSLLSSTQRFEVESLTKERLSHYLELEFIAKQTIPFDNPISDIEIKNINDAEKAAKQLRKKWKLGDEPISNITNTLEKNGVRIISIDFGHEYNHEGLSGWADNDSIPVIVVNNRNKDICRKRLTLLHELGHLILQIDTNLDLITVERICDAFAGAVLIPLEILIKEFGHNRTTITISELKRIKELYGISIKAIMVKAYLGKLISSDTFSKWKDYYSTTTSDFGQYYSLEEPQKFNQMLYKCLSERKIAFDKAAKLAQRDESDLKEEYLRNNFDNE